MEFHIYNTLTRQKELFVPMIDESVKIYSCGPTVYSDPHIGNLRYFVFCGLLGDICRYVLGYKTTHVMNITDVWHLTDDADAGEDKMEKGSRREGVSVWDVARKYENNFKQYLGQLHVQFDAHPRATEYIKEQIDIVQTLTDKWYTYIIPEDGIYMDTSRVSDYGKLLWPNYKQALAWLEAWSRVDADGKKNPTDFALWKFSPRDEQRQMEWIYEWDRMGILITDDMRDSLTEQEQLTRGFPGWHIECSAMSRALLGDTFDIHTWWVDHIAVHHSDEIAQSEHSFCTHGKWVNYWMHAQFLNINGAKVSKSAGDDLSLPWLEEKWFSPLDVRYFFFTGQYRSFLDFTYESLQAAKTTRQNMIKKIHAYVWERIVHFYDIQKEDISDILYEQMITPLLDDLDTPKFLAHLQKALWSINDEVLKVLLYLDKTVLHIWLYEWVSALMDTENTVQDIPAHVAALAQQRRDAKKARDFALADQLRSELLAQWWSIEDTKDGYEVVKVL